MYSNNYNSFTMFTMNNLPSLLLCVVLTSSSNAFSIIENGGARRSAAVKTASSSSSTCLGATSRKSFLQDLAVMGVTVATTSSVLTSRPQAASADITSKLASSAALRNVKTSEKRLKAMNVAASEDEYMKVKGALREAPLSEVRKSCMTLVNGGEDGPDAEKLQSTYKTFIGSLEKMDSTGSVAMRGRKLAKGEFEKLYQDTLTSLADFLVVAEEAASIPIAETTGSS
jgi:hypothetical protein